MPFAELPSGDWQLIILRFIISSLYRLSTENKNTAKNHLKINTKVKPKIESHEKINFTLHCYHSPLRYNAGTGVCLVEMAKMIKE